jgi:hypothetical protein
MYSDAVSARPGVSAAEPELKMGMKRKVILINLDWVRVDSRLPVPLEDVYYLRYLRYSRSSSYLI